MARFPNRVAYLEGTRSSPRPYRRIDTIPLATRIEARHVLREIQDLAKMLETAMLGESLSADGCLGDCDILAELVIETKNLLKE